MSKKNLAFLVNRFLDGGMETVLVEYLRHLAQQSEYNITLGIALHMGDLEMYRDRLPQNVHIHYFVRNGILTRWKRHRLTGRMAKPIKLFDELFLNPIRRLLMVWGIGQLSRQNDVIVDFDNSFSSFLKGVKKTKIVFLHSTIRASRGGDPRLIEKVKRRITIYDHVVTISKAMYQEACELFPNISDRICMIYNAINTRNLLEEAEKPEADHRIDIPYILCVTRLEEYPKDVTTLIKAYAILRSEYGHAEELYVISKGDSLQQLQNTATEMGVANDVHFLGFKGNPYPWIKHCRLLVQSSIFEGLPTAMVEALLLDKMMVATDCPTGPKEILNNGQAGLLTPVGDKEALAKAMHEALTDKALQQQMAEGRAAHKRLFTFDYTGKLFAELLK
ncbi:MAG TPA: glycosyltransferase [Prevotella sp.]